MTTHAPDVALLRAALRNVLQRCRPPLVPSHPCGLATEQDKREHAAFCALTQPGSFVPISEAELDRRVQTFADIMGLEVEPPSCPFAFPDAEPLSPAAVAAKLGAEHWQLLEHLEEHGSAARTPELDEVMVRLVAHDLAQLSDDASRVLMSEDASWVQEVRNAGRFTP